MYRVTQKTGPFEMRSGSHVQLAALRNRDLELQTTSPFSNHGSVERSTACFHHKKSFTKTMIVWKVRRSSDGSFNLGRYGRVPSKHEIKTSIKNFEETGSALKKKPTGRPRSARTPQNIEAVRISVLRSPRRSVRKLAAAVRLSRECVRRILHVVIC